VNDNLVFVVGAGQMGAGIAQVAAQSGRDVVVRDVAEAQLERGRRAIEGSLDRLVRRGTLTEADREATLRRIAFTTSLERVGEAFLVIEAIVENLEAKRALFRELDERADPGAVLATNTSTLPVTELAAATRRPERVIGMHFMNPVPVMKLVEVIRGLLTADGVHALVMDEARRYGKTPVTVNDSPGFVSNRILLPMINEAVYCLMEGVASREDIDTVMKLGMNHPMGPLELADFIGLDTCLAILEILYADLGDPKYRPCPLLRQYVRAGLLGRKTGRGFYTYEA
jgi:3-hydroxybutyryl-CoA dehydrogenase